MVYRRSFDASAEDSLAKLARWIRPGATVLELGCASGYFTAHLASLGCNVDVVEIDEAAAAQAAKHARRVVVGDLEGDTWIGELAGEQYDVIVCADVLEHLRDGARLLTRLRPLLAAGGELLLSVPNVAHSAVIANLVDDRFEYGAEGLLDPTHVRLYTWRSLAKLLEEAGFGVRAWDATTLPVFETEFRVRSEGLSPALREALLQRPWGLAYQWLVRATPDAPNRSVEPPATARTDQVPVRLLYAADAGSLSLESAVVAALPMGTGPVELQWRWPAPAAALRLLLADRLGVIRVRDWRLHRGPDILWSYDGNESNIECALSAVRLDESTFALTAPDAWIAPKVSADLAERADRMTATLAWPASPAHAGEFDVLEGLATAHRDGVLASGRRHDELVELAHLHQRNLEAEIAVHAATRADRDREVAKLSGLLEDARQEASRLDAAVKAQERIIAYRQSARWWFALPFLRVKLLLRRLTR